MPIQIANIKSALGVASFPDQSSWVGEYKEGQVHGKITMYNPK